MPQCVSCNKIDGKKKNFHEFTGKAHLRPLWLTALTRDDSAMAALDYHLRNTRGKHYVCIDHFSPESYTETDNYRALNKDAVPMSQRPSLTDYSDPVPTYSPPPTPVVVVPSLPRPLPVPPQSSIRLADAPVPPCYVCCCKKETTHEIKKDPNWQPPTPVTPTAPIPTVVNRPSSEYSIVSTASLEQLLSRCNSCPSGQCNLSFVEEAHALSCKCTCTSCGEVFMWSNSPVLPTANASAREKLRKVNVDMVMGSTITAVGTSRLNNLLKAVGLNKVSKTSFHRLKSDYVLPAVTAVFAKAQDEVFTRLKERLAKGEKLHVAGDGSFDTRGYSAMWCRYFLVDAETGEALVHVLMNKKETGSSGTLEVACLEKALNILAEKIGGVQHITTLVTDRHSAVIKLMKDRFPSIHHQFDPWHFFRNLALSLLKIVNSKYMKLVKVWSRTLINKAYDAVVKSQGNGDLASEMFRSSLKCITGVHDFTNDATFVHFKKCTHSDPGTNYPYLAVDGKAYKRLESMVFTEKNIADIKSVSWLLKTSTCESLNALAWRYAPKDNYFPRSGHELRTMMAMLHWNEMKREEINGTRIVTGKKPYFNHTLKKKVFRNVKSAPMNAWRAEVRDMAYQIRASLYETPYATIKRKKMEKQQQQEEWNKNNTPIVPHEADQNIEESEDEDEVPLAASETLDALPDDVAIDAIVEECSRLAQKDDCNVDE